MFTEIFELSTTAQFHLAQPLARARVDYLTHCAQQGFRVTTLRKTAQFLLVIIKYLDLQEEGYISIEQIKQLLTGGPPASRDTIRRRAQPDQDSHSRP
jgi:hypothetical protein